MTVRRSAAGAIFLLLAVSANWAASHPAAAAAQFQITHTPCLQLGNAPLVPYPGSQHDQIQIMWQAVPAGEGPGDTFSLDYRPWGAGQFRSAGPISTIDTGIQDRVNHAVMIPASTTTGATNTVSCIGAAMRRWPSIRHLSARACPPRTRPHLRS